MSMFSRPGRDESEEDLLRFQREFLERGSAPSANVTRVLTGQSSTAVPSTTTAAGASNDDLLPEKRPHERDVVVLQGNENVEVFPNPPRKKSKFKERCSSGGQAKSVAKNDEDVDAADLLDRHDTHVSVLLSQIKERDTKNCPVMAPKVASKGFPTVLHRNAVQQLSQKEEGDSDSKKSLFARQFAKAEEMDFGISTRGQSMTCGNVAVNAEDDMLEDDMYFSTPFLITGEGLQNCDMASNTNMAGEVQRIHEENMKKLAAMSEDEIMEEQTKLKQMLDPSILKFLQEKHKQQQPVSSAQNDSTNFEDDEGIDSNIVEDERSEIMQGNPGNQTRGVGEAQADMAEQILGTDISEKWLHMDQVEPEKLEWMKNCATPSARKTGSNEQARFDFEGNIVTADKDIPVFLGLHHHGEEPDRAGYSLEELFILSRSNFLQQRVLAINLLAKIIEKDRCGALWSHLEQPLLPILLDAGLPFLLRWSLDNNADALIVSSVTCFRAMLLLPGDEFAADLLCSGWYRSNELPCLRPTTENVKESTDQESGTALPDVDAVRQDLIKGLVQMRLIPRLRYILEVCRPPSSSVSTILDILIRIARHSTEAAHCVAKCPRLLETILIQFLPSSWKLRDASDVFTDVYGHPLPKALKLFRVLCSTGKYLADTLVTKFGLITKILRFITVPADQMQLEVVEALELATESFRIWTICVSYGLACDIFSDAYSHITSQLQALSSLTLDEKSPVMKHNSICGIALVNLIEAVVHVAGSKAELQAQLTTKLSNDSALNGMDASHLPPSPVDWSHVTGLLPVIGHCSRLLKDQFLNLDERMIQDESFHLLSSIFNLLASFYQKFVNQPSYSPVECLDEIEKFLVNDICLPIMTSQTMKTILTKLRDYSSYYAKEGVGPRTVRIPSLPDYGCFPFGECRSGPGQEWYPRCLQRGTPFSFLLSFTRLSMVITSCHKGVTDKFLTFVTNHEVMQYLKTNSTPGKNDCESQCFFVKVEQHFQYFLIKLFYNILLQCGPLDGQLTAIYHTASLLLFSRLFPGDEYYAHDLMSTVIFNSAFFHESKDESAATITSNLSEMGIDTVNVADHHSRKREKCSSRAELLSEAHKDLLSIRSTFMSSFAQMRHALAKSRARCLHQPQNITSFLLEPVDGTMLPLDWMFLPLVELHNYAVKAELASQPSDRPLTGSLSVVKRTLQWVLLLEEWRPVILHKVPHTARIARLMCTFLTGSDLFLDNTIHNYLKTLFHSYTHSSQLAWLDFNLPVPGITSFFDLFSSFLSQYEAVSFGDALFSSFVLLPLQQRYNEMFRKAVWNEHVSLFRSFSLSFDQLPVPIEYYLVPAESNFEILTLQLRALATGALRNTWSPVFYLIAVHHLCSFIFSKPVGQVTEEQTLKSFNEKLNMMKQVLILPDQSIRTDIISYWKPSRDSPKGFQVFSSLPPTRALLLRNHNEPEEAWNVWSQST